MRASSTADVLSIHTPDLFRAAVERAANLLRAGAVVALPTETVYGLAANALDPDAVSGREQAWFDVFAWSGRPLNNPIIVHVASPALARSCVSDWPETAMKLATAFWPGPLTMVMPKSACIPGIVTAGGATVGVRWPRHPFIEAVIRECGFPLAAPSANRSAGISPTTAAHVMKELGGELPLIVDGGPAQVGIESTVVDVTTTPAKILRPGMIRLESLAAVIGDVVSDTGHAAEGATARSPGQLRKHYSPRAVLRVMTWRDDADLRRCFSADLWAGMHVIAHSRIPFPDGFGRVSVIPHDAEAFARAIYAELHASDEAGAELIVVEAPPDAPEWRAIADRLNRASVP